MKIIKAIKLWWLKHSRNENKFVDSPLVNYGEWIGGNDRIVFTDRPDPLLLSYQDRTKEMRRQIREDVN